MNTRATKHSQAQRTPHRHVQGFGIRLGKFRFRWMRRKSRLLSLAASLVVVAVILCGVASAQETAEAPVLSPEDISTPAYIPGYIPTVTPAPTTAATETEAYTSASPVISLQSMAAGEPSVTGGASYVVQEGDTLLSVSIEIGIDLDDMPCLLFSDFRTSQPLVIGDRIDVPFGEITCHQAQQGETLASVAAGYHLNPEQFVKDSWNELALDDADVPLHAGRYIRYVEQSLPKDSSYLGFVLQRPISESPHVSYGVGGPVSAATDVQAPENWPYGSGYFDWPAYGWISQEFHGRHRAIDIAATLGSVITAADRGVVVRAGWNNNGYGNFVVLDHNIDYITLYAHLDSILVQEGDVVAKGQIIGTIGSTGNSTGPHLHFEVRDFGARIDPMEVLVHP